MMRMAWCQADPDEDDEDRAELAISPTELAFTGINSYWILLSAILLVVLGVVADGASRRLGRIDALG